MPAVLLRADRAESSDLARRVRNFLHSQSNPDLRSLQVEVEHDVVTVRGCLPSPRFQALASEYCRRVAGVRQVVNETTVA
jgi:osmotically-inducible protein OsmY